MIRAVAASYGGMRNEKPQTGRFIDDEDVRLRRRVAFIGSEVERKLFAGVPPLGETIRIGGQRFEVVGVGEEKVQLSNYNRPDKECIFIPWTTMGGLTDNKYVGTFIWQAVTPALEPQATKQVREFLANRYRYNPTDERALNLFGSSKAKAITGPIIDGLKLVLTFIGVVTLAIGGVGIMNIMFVNVQERTREIGVRMALGARRRDILLQFLLEGLATTFAGGLIGIAAVLRPGLAAQPAAVPGGTARRRAAKHGHLPAALAPAGRHLLRDPDGGGTRGGLAAGAEGVASRSDRIAALRISTTHFVDAQRHWPRRHENTKDLYLISQDFVSSCLRG